MEKNNKKIKIRDRSDDDRCFLCKARPVWGGHYFQGVRDEGKKVIEVKDESGIWAVIEHSGYIWFCPQCKGKILT